jgi:glycosyltransferase involved in cell wall biosynthesis
MVESTRPMVSVVMITYLHEAFIAEAINGVLMQQCNFDVELIIADDCSPDNTKVVVESFKDYPNYKWINYIRHDRNKGMMGNFIWALEQASGKYTALCEGDDYWTDSLKLQNQVDFLERNEECVLCFHDVKILQPNGIIEEDFITNIPKDIKLNQKALVVNSNFIHTPAVMFRSEYLKDMPSTYSSPVGDYLLYLWLTNFGDIGYIPESIMGVYRYGVGVHSAKSEEKKKKEWFWVLLMSTFMVNKTENLDYLENRLVSFLKQSVSWDDLIYDYSFKEVIEKFVMCCNKMYLNERQSNIKNMSTRMIFRVFKKRVFNRLSKNPIPFALSNI